ncbi:enoyl-CoA hydratase [Kiloniella laminariae]|uniref:enoyl-CoA hydratase n=1 Tax=Kiloniella laminariae TaxID=454162 RepID=UPI00037E26FF|nr:enoyl-CoA hydratase [Kiloniella laminariae]
MTDQALSKQADKVETGEQILLWQLDDSGVLRLTLNDAARRNALSEKMLGLLEAALQRAEADPSVRVIVLAASGPAFCAGHDLKELRAARAEADGGAEIFSRIFTRCSAVMQAIVRHRCPVIAEVAGIATAAGCQLVASCDLAVAADTARFATPGVHIGLFCSTPMVALSRNLSSKHAMEMLLTGDLIPATRAEAIGLVNRVVRTDALGAATLELAQAIARKSALTLAIGKRAFYEQRELPLEEAYGLAGRVMVENMLKADAEEGINAFVEKRPAVWRDK